VFVNARGEPLSRWGFAYLLKQHVATAARKQPGLTKKRVSPHVLRHTCRSVSTTLIQRGLKFRLDSLRC
jgi:integrase/recombinase XerD